MRKGTIYRIVVRSELGDRYASAFEGMHMETVDQPHLFGILNRINGLGLELLSVQAMPDARPSTERDRDPKQEPVA